MRSAVLLLLCLIATACETPRYEGPMVQELPNGLIGEPEARQDHEMFPDRILERNAYVVFGSTDFTGIYIRKLAGNTMRADVVAAQVVAQATETDSGVTYGPIEDIRVDDRLAWAWMEETRDRDGLQYVEYRAVVPYDSVSYSIEFSTGDPWWKTRPDSMRAVTRSFAVGKVEWNWPLLIGFMVAAALILRFFWGRSGVKIPSQDYSLPKFERPNSDDAEADDAEDDPGTAAADGSPETGEATTTPEEDRPDPDRNL